MGTVQEVRIAKRTGFWYGVREAIDKAKEASAAGKSTRSMTSTMAPRSSSARTVFVPT
jgi:hypothetical protein